MLLWMMEHPYMMERSQAKLLAQEKSAIKCVVKQPLICNERRCSTRPVYLLVTEQKTCDANRTHGNG